MCVHPGLLVFIISLFPVLMVGNVSLQTVYYCSHVNVLARLYVWLTFLVTTQLADTIDNVPCIFCVGMIMFFFVFFL